jgi:hypothetical protein
MAAEARSRRRRWFSYSRFFQGVEKVAAARREKELGFGGLLVLLRGSEEDGGWRRLATWHPRPTPLPDTEGFSYVERWSREGSSYHFR